MAGADCVGFFSARVTWEDFKGGELHLALSVRR